MPEDFKTSFQRSIITRYCIEKLHFNLNSEGGQDYLQQVNGRNIHISGSVNALANVQSLERKHRKTCARMKASIKGYKTGNKGQAILYENLNANL